MAGASAEEVLDVLNHSTWKTAHEIKREIEKGRGITKRSFFGRVNLGVIYVQLFRLEESGMVERRDRTKISKYELWTRGGQYPHEFRMTEEGIRRKVERGAVDKKKTFTLLPQENTRRILRTFTNRLL